MGKQGLTFSVERYFLEAVTFIILTYTILASNLVQERLEIQSLLCMAMRPVKNWCKKEVQVLGTTSSFCSICLRRCRDEKSKRTVDIL